MYKGHTCSNCQYVMDIRPLVDDRADKLGFLPINMGVKCPSCGLVYKVGQAKMHLITLGALASLVAVAVLLEKTTGIGVWDTPALILFFFAGVAVLMLTRRYVTISPDDNLRDDPNAEIYEFEETGFIDIRTHEPISKSEFIRNERRREKLSKKRDWVCTQCENENPGEFEICWNCNAERWSDI